MRLVLFVAALSAAAGALACRVWGAAIAAGVLALALLPQVTVGLAAALRRETAPQPRLYLPVGLSGTQRLAAGMVLVGVPVAVWRFAEDGWVALAVIGPLAAAGVIWLGMAIRREGWSGEKLDRG